MQNPLNNKDLWLPRNWVKVESIITLSSTMETEEKYKDHYEESMKHWRSWGSWFSWGSPVGLGLFLIAIGVFLVLLHLANIIH